MGSSQEPATILPAMNGLRHFPVALKSHSPLDVVVIMLGTNDFKARFSPSAQKVAANLHKLVTCARQTGGGPGPWDDPTPPRMGLIVPPPLPARVDDPNWERAAEWAHGRTASLALAAQVLRLGETLDVPVLDAGKIVAGSCDDPIHLDAASHAALGRAAASWISHWA
jgi:lysophospholipase L1-like esterase